MTTKTMTVDNIQEIAIRTIDEYRERCQENQHASGDSWLKVQNDWQGWDSGVIVLDPEEFIAEHPERAEDVPDDCVATIHSGFAGSQYATYIRDGDDQAAVIDAVLGCLPSED